MAAVLGALPAIGAADEIRHTSFGSFMLGTYAASGDRCAANDKSSITISETKFTMSEDSCAVRWIVETVGRSGAIFSVHAACARAAQSTPKVMDVIFQPTNDEGLLVGSSFDNLKPYVRCPRR
jgi:hypothetical protein